MDEQRWGQGLSSMRQLPFQIDAAQVSLMRPRLFQAQGEGLVVEY